MVDLLPCAIGGVFFLNEELNLEPQNPQNHDVFFLDPSCLDR